jgi:hypothetical protein
MTQPRDDELIFGDYMERRDRCKAMQFRYAAQAPLIAELFGCATWHVERHENGALTLQLTFTNRDDLTILHRDYIREDDPYLGTYSIVRRQEFQSRFEDAPKPVEPQSNPNLVTLYHPSGIGRWELSWHDATMLHESLTKVLGR